MPIDQLIDQYITAVKKGILKTISKMGISTLRSYHAAQQFEAVGLNREVIDKYFTGTPSRIERRRPGRDRRARPSRGTAPASSRREPGALELDFGGEYHFRLDGEKHLWNPTTIAKLQHAVMQNDREGLRRVRPGDQRPGPRPDARCAGCSSSCPASRCRWTRSSRPARSSSGSTPAPCRTARSARRPTRRWPSP